MSVILHGVHVTQEQDAALSFVESPTVCFCQLMQRIQISLQSLCLLRIQVDVTLHFEYPLTNDKIMGNFVEMWKTNGFFLTCVIRTKTKLILFKDRAP